MRRAISLRTIPVIWLLGLACLYCTARAAGPITETKPDEILTAAGSVALPGVEGRLDHLAADPGAGRLYLTALENHSLEVVDLNKKARVRSLPGLNEPQGLLCLPQFNLLLACSRGDGACWGFAADTLAAGCWADLGHNADNVRFDANTGTVYAGAGGEPGAGTLAVLDVKCFLPPDKGGRCTPGAKVELSGHPESFQIAPDGRRIYVNLPDAHGIAVIDATSDSLKRTATWPVTAGAENFSMALSDDGARLFIACRQPARLVCYDTATGKELARADCAGDADDLFYDAQAHRVYVIGGEGFVDVFAVAATAAPDAAASDTQLERLAHVPTRPRARTGLFIPKLDLLCVVAPKTSDQPAAVLLFRVAR